MAKNGILVNSQDIQSSSLIFDSFSTVSSSTLDDVSAVIISFVCILLHFNFIISAKSQAEIIKKEINKYFLMSAI